MQTGHTEDQVQIDEFGNVTVNIHDRMALYTVYRSARAVGLSTEDTLSLLDVVNKAYDYYHPQDRIEEV